MFDTHFIAFLADTDESCSIHYNIRYQVFCEETGFEDCNAFHEDEEKDEYDQEAAHFIVQEKSTGQWVAAMRLILGRNGILPTEHLCSDLDRSIIGSVAREEIAEISRLCIVKSLRRRLREPSFPYEVIDGQTGGRKSAHREGLKESEILMGLLRAVYTWASSEGVRYCYFLISPALARLVGRLNLNLKSVGGRCQHRGERIPYFANLDEGRQELLQYGPARVAEMLQRGSIYSSHSELRQAASSGSKTAI